MAVRIEAGVSMISRGNLFELRNIRRLSDPNGDARQTAMLDGFPANPIFQLQCDP
jgi:hypothetical protein